MKSKRQHTVRLRAMTLPEVLVIMIVSAIVFMSVMDGLGLFRRHALTVAEGLTGNIRFYDGYYRLHDIVAASDSITGDGSRLSCWRGGAQNVSLAYADSTLTATYGSAADTLLHRVGEVRVYRRDERSGALDSLTVVLETSDGRMEIPLAVSIPVQIKARQTITQMEKDYEYE